MKETLLLAKLLKKVKQQNEKKSNGIHLECLRDLDILVRNLPMRKGPPDTILFISFAFLPIGHLLGY